MTEKTERKALTTLSKKANDQVKRIRTIDNYINHSYEMKGYYINLACELMELLPSETIEKYLKLRK